MAADSEHPQPASEHLFLRNATGLVREVRPLSSLVINYIVGSPVQVLGAGLFFALSLYPGGNFFLGLLIITPMMLAYSYTFGLMTAAIPRSGGDYTIVSRVIHPTVGIVSSVFMLLAQFLSVAFFGIACVTTGIIPGLMAVGLIGGNQTYIDWANDIAASKGWQFALGSLVIVIASLMFLGGWRWTLRMQNGIFLFTLAGIVVATLIALFTSRSGFISDFNSFAQPTTGSQRLVPRRHLDGPEGGRRTPAPGSRSPTPGRWSACSPGSRSTRTSRRSSAGSCVRRGRWERRTGWPSPASSTSSAWSSA